MSGRGPIVATVVGLLGVWGCGGSGGASSSPTAPSGLPSAGAGAVITGTVQVSSGGSLAGFSAGASAAWAAASAPAGTTIEVVGAGISAPVQSNGQFALQGVPPGNARLRIVGQQLDASFGVSQVQVGETITLSVLVSGGVAVVQSESRSSSGVEELEGRIESLPDTQPSDTMIVSGRTVRVTSGTQIRGGAGTLDFGDLQIGWRVHVRGRPDGPVLVADSVQVQNQNGDLQIPVNGVVSGLTGTAEAFEFEVNGREIHGDGLTAFFGTGGRTIEFEDLEDGLRVEVKARQRDGYLYAERIHVNLPEDDDDDQDDSASIEGRLNAMTGDVPDLELQVGSTTVRTSTSTRVQRRGDTQTLEVLALGQTLHVVGVRQSDGSIEARKIQIKDDEPEAEFEIEGSVGGLKGSCPALTFTINGYAILTDAGTTFEGTTCASVRNGMKVTVHGTRLADGRIQAAEVTR